MVKKLIYFAVVIILALTFSNTLFAQQEEEAVVEDVADISLEDLLDVEISTAGKKAERIGDIPASVVLVTRHDIETYGYQTLAEILENIPGLYQIDDTFYPGNFAIRGFWNETANRNVIILVNDVPQTDNVISGYPLQQINIPVEAIDRIEVVRGPMSVIYGTGAFFGVINIKTNLIGDEEQISMVSAAAGTEKSYRLFARASGKDGDFQYSFNGSFYDTEGMDRPLGDMVSDPSILPAYGVPVDHTTKERMEDTEKFFNFSGSFKGFSFNSSYTEAQFESLVVLPSVSDGTLLTTKVVRVNFGYAHKFSEKASLDATVGYFQNRMSFDYDFVTPNIYALQNNESFGYMAEVNLFLEPSEKISVTLGGNYHKILDARNETNVPLFALGNTDLVLPPGESIVTQSLFTQIDFKLAKSIKLVVGARLEQVPEYTIAQKIGITDTEDPLFGTEVVTEATYDQTKAEFIPRVALIISPSEDHAIKLLYGKAINRPSFFQSRDLVENINSLPLEPETIQTFELNYLATPSPKFTIGLSLFYNLLDQLIYRTLFVSEGVVTTRFSNVGEMTTTGAELTLKAIPFEGFQLELSGTYQKTEDKRDGFEDIDVPYSPNFLGYIKASLFVTKDISIAVTGTYVDEMEAFYDDTLDVPARIGEKVDSYFLLGANLRVRNLFGTGMYMNFRGSNLLDTDVFYPTTSNVTWANKGILAKGMSFLFTVGYKFMP
jgi:outer membrane receptor protein involved in Fe transport